MVIGISIQPSAISQPPAEELRNSAIALIFAQSFMIQQFYLTTKSCFLVYIRLNLFLKF